MAPETDYDFSQDCLEPDDVVDFNLRLGHFLNNLISMHYVPLSVSATLCQELQKMAEVCLSHMRGEIMRALQESSASEELTGKVMDCLKTMPLIGACAELSTSRRIEKFITTKFKYVAPRQVKVGELEYSYVSIKETVVNVVTDPTFIKGERTPSSTLLRDIKDGEVYKENPYFKAHPDAYALALYSDAVDISNPLGASKGQHKMVKFYVTFVDMPKHERSQIDHVFPVMTVNNLTLKQITQEQLMEPLMADLMALEAGVELGGCTYYLNCVDPTMLYSMYNVLTCKLIYSRRRSRSASRSTPLLR